MLDLAIKDLKEHRVRTVLTILGIIIAITAIISLGSISAGVNELITSSGSKIGSSTIFVTKRFDMSMMSGPPGSFDIGAISAEEIESLRSMAGVSRVVPIISKIPGSMFGEVDAIDMNDLDLFGAADLTLKEGYWPDNDEQGVVMGSVIAGMMGASAGDFITLNNKQVEVFGVAEEGQGSYDLLIVMPYAYGEDIYDMQGEANQIVIEPADISFVDEIKNTIEEEHDDLMAMTVADALKTAEQSTATLNIFTLGIGFVASLVAGIGIIITMYTSVLERRREIGILKAVGAFRRTIFKQIIEEGLILSVVGSLISLAISFFFVDMLNNVLLGGTKIAVITPLLAGGAVAYGIILTLLFSMYPAWVAIKTDPIDAIRKG
jgi:putative ABC transport system permease protein